MERRIESFILRTRWLLLSRIDAAGMTNKPESLGKPDSETCWLGRRE